MPKHTTPERVTDILREFLDSGQNMTEFAKNKDLGRSTFFEWVKGAAVPGGRQGLTEEERGRLDEQKNRNNGTDPQKVTEVLREFLDSGQNVTEFAKNKKMERNTLANWVKGIKVPGGRQGLTDEERGKLDERAQEKEIDRKAPYVTEILREFLGSDRTMTEFAKNKNMERSTLANWVKGVAIAGGRAGLTPEEQERLDERSQEKTSRTNPQGITDTLREFLRSGQTMPIFTRNKNINRTTFYSWAKGTKVPDGRAGLTLDEQVKLDERLQNKTDPQAVTEVLREFLGSNKSMGEFAKSKKITPNTFYTWAKGVAGGRAGLTPEEQVKLDERRQENLRRGPGLEQGVAGTGVGAAVEEMPQAVAWSPAAAVLPQQAWESHAQPSLPQYAAASSPLALEGPAGAAGALGSRTFAAAAADRPALSGLSSFGANGRMLPPPFPSSAVSSDYLHSPGTPAPVSGNSNRRLPPLPNRDPQKDPFFGSGGSQGQARGGR